MSSTKNKAQEVLTAVTRRAPHLADYVNKNKEYWLTYTSTTWAERTAVPTPVTSLRGRPPTTLPALLAHLKGLKLSFIRGLVSPGDALNKRLDILDDTLWKMRNQEGYDKYSKDIRTLISNIRYMDPRADLKGDMAIPPKVRYYAPSDVLRLFQFAAEMGA
jgi:hypothetical protein